MRKEFVQFKDVKEPFFVRVGLDEGRVRYFIELYESGAKVDPPTITEDRNLVDGRHRKAALIRLEHAGTEFNVTPNAPKEDLIIRAFKANSGGPKPPTQDDLDHTLELLLETGVSRETILKRMTSTIPFPRLLVRRHLSDVQSKIAKRRLNEAMEAMADEKLNLTVKEAAKKFNVNPSSLRARLKASSNAKKRTEAEDIRGSLTKRFHSFAMSNSHVMRKTILAYKDGEISLKEALAVIEYAKRLSKHFDHSIREWEKRLNKSRSSK